MTSSISGGVSVHNFIVVDTPAGVGFMNPWSGETIIVQGVSLGQLTIDNFMPVVNDHLRQCLSGALAWEQGIIAAPHTVYARSHELGQIDKVAFDPATDVVDFRYYGTREQIYMTDSAEGVVISNSGTGQALILLGVTKAALSVTISSSTRPRCARIASICSSASRRFPTARSSRRACRSRDAGLADRHRQRRGALGRDRRDLHHRLAVRHQYRARLRPGRRTSWISAGSRRPSSRWPT